MDRLRSYMALGLTRFSIGVQVCSRYAVLYVWQPSN